MKVWESEYKPKGIYKVGIDPCQSDKEHNPFPVEEMKKRIEDLDWSQLDKKYIHEYIPITPNQLAEIMDSRPEKVFKNQDSSNIGPGFSKEFYNELHRFYSQGNRRSGRTHLLARVLVNTAIETGEIIYLHDHHSVFKNDRDINRHLLSEIRKVIALYDKKGLPLNYQEEERNGGYIRINLTGNLLEATRVYNIIKNDYQPLANKEYPLTPDEAFGTRNKKLLLIKI